MTDGVENPRRNAGVISCLKAENFTEMVLSIKGGTEINVDLYWKVVFERFVKSRQVWLIFMLIALC